ncbi:MAG: hypothetical protein ABR531_03745, partial [Bacteroidales bacterium]
LFYRVLSYLNAASKAFSLAFHELLGDAEGINRETEQYLSVTAEEIADTSARVFSPTNCSVIQYMAKEI